MSATVFVGNLSWSTNEEDLCRFMSSSGEVLSTEIKRHEDSSRSKGWGLVDFVDAASAMAAVELLNLTEFDGRKIHVRLDRSHLSLNDGKSVFLNNIPLSMKEQDLIFILKRFQPIDCQIITTMTGRSRGFAIVKFATTEQTELVVSQVHDTFIGGRRVECKIDDRGHKVSHASVAKTIIIRNVSATASDEIIRNHFSACGTILTIRRSNRTPDINNDICTVKFSTCEAALRACNDLHHSTLPNGDKLRIKLKGRKDRDTVSSSTSDDTSNSNSSDPSSRQTSRGNNDSNHHNKHTR
eukprot:gene6909-14027_t